MNKLELTIFENLFVDFSDSFRRDFANPDQSVSAVEEMARQCIAEGISESTISLARKAAAVCVYSEGVNK